MPKKQSALEIPLTPRNPSARVSRWLYGELRRAVLSGQLRPGTRLPATRDFARQYKTSRGTVVSVFERMHSEGYLVCRVAPVLG